MKQEMFVNWDRFVLAFVYKKVKTDFEYVLGCVS